MFEYTKKNLKNMCRYDFNTEQNRHIVSFFKKENQDGSFNHDITWGVNLNSVIVTDFITNENVVSDTSETVLSIIQDYFLNFSEPNVNNYLVANFFSKEQSESQTKANYAFIKLQNLYGVNNCSITGTSITVKIN